MTLRIRWPALVALLLALASLAARRPGVPMYDSVTQYEQALTADYSDWHPPIMAHLWALLLHVRADTVPFFLIQMALWWGGLGLIATRLAGLGRPRAAGFVLAIGAFPLFLGWGTAIIKDAQMAACLVMVAGLWGWWRVDGRRVPPAAVAAIAVLIGYATLVRGNAVFACVPLALALMNCAGVRRLWARALLALAATAAILAVAPILNQRAMDAAPTHTDRALFVWDIAAITHLARLPNPPGLTREQWKQVEQRGCYTPFFWNPYGQPAQCNVVGQTLAYGSAPRRTLMRDWLGLIATHPIAYAEHRLLHLNATLRFLVGAGEPDGIPPVDPEPNPYGLGQKSNLGGQAIVWLARWTNAMPLGWPIVWLSAAAALLWSLRDASGEDIRLARALALSAITMSGSFAVISIASDLRYHLWSMLTAGLAVAIGWRGVPAARRKTGGAIVATITLAAIAARFLAPPVYVPMPAYVPPPGAAR